MKNFNILGVCWKMQLLGGGRVSSRKTKIEGRGGAACTVCQFKRGLARKRFVVFLNGGGGGGVDIPIHTMVLEHEMVHLSVSYPEEIWEH